MSIFLEISAVLMITTSVAFIMKWLKQPLVVGYILAGILVGPYALDILHSHQTLELFSKFGITILLFIIGLHMSPKVIKELGTVSFLVGIGQVLVTSTLGFLIALFLGINGVAALYVAIGVTLSSTIIILKLISDKGDAHTLYGKITISLLLIQDLVATVALIMISSTASGGDSTLLTLVGMTALKLLALLAVLVFSMKWVIPKISHFAASNRELLFLFSLTWGLGLAALFYGLGLSVEIGALAAGVALSASAYAEEISSRLSPLRDFFLTLFFVMLGSGMVLSFDPQLLLPVAALSFFVLIGNPIILMIIMNLLGYHKKTGFMAGLAIAQISEFSLIMATLGMQVGHLEPETVTILTLVGLITISASTYLILYSEKLYPTLQSVLKLLEIRKKNRPHRGKHAKYDIFLFGFNRVGHDFLTLFKKLESKTAVVDFDPDVEERLPSRFKHFFYGDAGNIEFLNELSLQEAKLVLSTFSAKETNLLLIKHIKEQNPDVVIIAYAMEKDDAMELYQAGASYVVIPHHLSAKKAISFIKRVGFSLESFERKKEKHLRELTNRIT